MRVTDRWWRIGLLILGLLLMTGCGEDRPVTLGFLGGLSGKVADLGIAGRNGFLLAIEQQNARGGIHGQPIGYLALDDRQDPETARKAVQELIDRKVDAIIGPMTSSIAMSVVDLANDHRLLMMGTTVTTDRLTGIDDYFFRTLAPVSTHSAVSARYLRTLGEQQKAMALIDLDNEAYTRDWVNAFSKAYLENGGEFLGIEPFHSSQAPDFAALAVKVTAEHPDLVVLVMNSLDAALMAKQLRAVSDETVIATSEWAGTERLIELGGAHVEGVVVPQYHDRSSQDPAYLEFVSAFEKRFGQSPGFPGMVTYNATNAVIQALLLKQDNESLKEVLLRMPEQAGIQGGVKFDQFGESPRKSLITRIHAGRFEVVD